MQVEITRVWGNADEYNLEFINTGNNVWIANIPPDMEDGQYACLFNAIDEHGGMAMWTGILYMHNGSAYITFDNNRESMQFLSNCEKMIFNPNGTKLTIGGQNND